MSLLRLRALSPLANSSSLLAGEVCAKLLGLATMLYVIRLVDLASFGFSALALAIVGYLDAAFLRGAELEGVRRLSPWPANAPGVARRTLLVRVGVGTGFAAAVTAAGLGVGGELGDALLIAGAIPLLRAAQPRWLYQAWGNQKRVALGRIFGQAAGLVAALLLVSPASSAQAVVGVAVLAELVLAIWLLPPVLRLFLSASHPGPPLGDLLRRSMTVGVGFVLAQGIATGDVVMIGAILGAADAGVYTAAYRVIEAVFVLSAALSLGYLPQVAATAASPQLGRTLRSYWRVALLVGLPVCCVGALLAPQIVALLFSAAYEGASWPLRILFVAAAFEFANIVVLHTLPVLGRTRVFVSALALALPLNLAVNLVVVPVAGLVGAACVTALTAAFVFAVARRAVADELPLGTLLRELALPVRLGAAPVLAAATAIVVGVPAVAAAAIGAGLLVLVAGSARGELMLLLRSVDAR